ncbi:MAG: hypothetical protein ACT4P6_01620 [Gemmatimonadaceae bacterium]
MTAPSAPKQSTNGSPIVRHFRSIVLWPLQLVPQPGTRAEHWEVLAQLTPNNWRPVPYGRPGPDMLAGERHYSEFVSFLPYVQQFLFGEAAEPGQGPAYGASPLRAYRRNDIRSARLTFYDDPDPVEFRVARVELCFFADVDLAILAVEIQADDLPIARALDTLFRFGRVFPAFWTADGRAGQCLERVEWISTDGSVLAASDFEQKERYVSFVAEHRASRTASHWEHLLQPMVSHHSGRAGPLRYRQIEYYRMPWTAYLAVDDPTTLGRPTFARIALGASSGDPTALPFSSRSLENFERDYCFDRYWAPGERSGVSNTRYLCSGHGFAMVGSSSDSYFTDANSGLLGQFRHQYFRLALLSHFHRAALLMLSDRLVLALNMLDIRRVDSVKEFKRRIRRTMETFLRFTHRYWFHEVSTQDQARALFRMWSKHLGTEQLFAEVREEVHDMSQYLDSDSLRRQAGTVVRLTVVTALGLIGTIATGLLGMNIFDYSAASPLVKLAIFLLILVPSVGLIFLTIARSKGLADFLEGLSDERLSIRAKAGLFARAWRRDPR